MRTVRIWLVAAAAAAIALVGVPAGQAATPSHGSQTRFTATSTHGVPGRTLRIRIPRPPVDGPAHVRVTGPHQFHKQIRQATTLAHLRPGTYTVHVKPVRTSEASSFPDANEHIRRVTNTKGASVVVRYHGAEFAGWQVHRGPGWACNGTHPALPWRECEALLELRDVNHQALGEVWRNDSPCRWLGVKCANGHVTSLDVFDATAEAEERGDGDPNIYTVSTVPASIGHLAHLKTLVLSDQGLASLPGTIGNLRDLRTLSIGVNRLTRLPWTFGNLTHLHALGMGINRLTRLPWTLRNLTHLRVLSMGTNQFTKVPRTLRNLTHLRELRMDNNQLTRIPDFVGRFTRLTWLEADGNRIKTFPAIGDLTHLKVLGLDHNQLATVPRAIGRLTGLQLLQLGHNKLAALPHAIGSLTNLQTLNLEDNELTALPADVGKLTGLTLLNVNDNQIGAIPDAIGDLTHLEILWFENNQLTTVPAAVGRLAAAQHLWLEGNQISTVSPEIKNLTHLTQLRLDNNELSGDISSWVGPLSKQEWTRDNSRYWIYLYGNDCLNVGGNADLETWMNENTQGSRDGCP